MKTPVPVIVELKPQSLGGLIGEVPAAAHLQRWRSAVESLSDQIRKDLGLRENPLTLLSIGEDVNLRVSGIAGLLRIRNLTIQVAPKYAKGDVAASNWQSSVLNVLAVARRRSFTYSRVDAIGGGRATFIDHIALAYADALDKALRHEAIQTYKTREEVSLYLRGTLLIERQLQTILTKPRALHCSVSYLDTDNSLNQLLHWAGQALLRSAFDSSVRRSLSATLGRLPAVSDIPTYLLHIPKYLPRQYEHYREAFEVAVTMARGYGYGQEWGIQSGYGYVLNMESIFEGFVENCLQTIARARFEREGWECLPQSSALFAVAAIDNCKSYHTRPDNRLVINGETVLLIDAKYKKAPPSSSSRHHRPENTDLYQLLASLVAHRCNRALIVYPLMASDQDEIDTELRAWRVSIEGGRTVLIAAMGLDISDLGNYHQLHRVRDDLVTGVERVLEWQLSP